MDEQKINYFERFLEFIKQEEKTYTENDESECAMFKHLISMMGEEIFNRCYKYYFIEHIDFNEGFLKFHKSMSHNDFYKYDELEGHLDMVFWILIYKSQIPEDLFKKFKENN